MGRNLSGFGRKIGWPETVMDGTVKRSVGQKGHGQCHHAWSPDESLVIKKLFVYSLITTKKYIMESSMTSHQGLQEE